MSHDITIESQDNRQAKTPEYRAVCTCGWTSLGHWFLPAGAEESGRRHVRLVGTDHDLEVVHSGAFARVECTCGWVSEWKHETHATSQKWLRSAESTHRTVVRNAGGAA